MTIPVSDTSPRQVDLVRGHITAGLTLLDTALQASDDALRQRLETYALEQIAAAASVLARPALARSARG